MLTALILWVYITAIAGAYGWLALAILRRLIQAGEEVRIETPVVLLLGVALVGTLASILSLFIPVSLTANLVVVLVVAPGIGLTWQGFRSWLERVGASARRANPAVWAGALLLAVAVLRYGSVTPTNFDTGFYHAQAIRWIESYRAVPGLGNLFGRLAFDSGWFLPQALFSFAFLGLRSFHLLNPWLCLVAGIWMLNGISNLLCGRRALSDFVRLGMLPPLIYFLVRDSASPGTDLPAAILVWVALTLALERVEEGGFRRLDVAGVVLSCLAFYAVTVKLAALPLLILPLCLLVREFRLRNGGRAVGILGLAALLIFAPWLTRNVILSGYLIYPFAAINLFNVDWKVPVPYTVNEAHWITSWGRIPGMDNEQVLAMPFTAWFPIWLGRLSPWFKLIFAFSIGMTVFYTVFHPLRYRLRGRQGGDPIGLAAVALSAYAGVVFWFISAPDVRFGYGFIFFLFLLLAAPIVRALYSLDARQGLALGMAVVLVFIGGSAVKAATLPDLRSTVLLPADYPRINTETQHLTNFDVYYPGESQQCWYHPLPCAPFPSAEVILRGSTLQDGFRNQRFNPITSYP
jgi:hypothetical protein